MNFCFSSRCFSHFSRGLQLAALILLGLCALSPQAGGLRNPRFLVFSPAPTAHTFVSHSGADVAPCSRNAPCATLQFALTQTLPGGTITAINAGDYGPMTITQAVTVDGEGTQAGITAPGGGDGITVNAAAMDTVILRGLSIVAQGNGFTTGIRRNTGNLVVDDCRLSGFSQLTPSIILQSGTGMALIENTILTNCYLGILDAMTGAVSLRQVTIQGCQAGVVAINQGARIDIWDSQITQNAQNGLVASNGATLSASGCTLTGNGTAVLSNANSIVRLTNNDIYNNTTALNANGGIISTTGNNRRAGNSATATPIAPSDQPNRSIAVQ